MDFIPNSINQINELTQGLQTGSAGGQFNLGDDTFANLLNSKLDGLAGQGMEVYTELMGPLGMPAGLNIEGLSDPFKVNAVDNNTLSELSLNQSEAGGEDENILKSAGNKIESLFDKFDFRGGGSIDIADLINTKSINQNMTAVKSTQSGGASAGFEKFLHKQAAGIYNHMGKTIAHNLGDILSAI